MATSFTVTPTWVYPIEPAYHNIITQTESMKKRYYNISGTSTAQFRLVWEGMSNTQHTTLRSHYNSTYGEYEPFYLACVPSYIESGNSMYGRWVTGSLKEIPKSKHWECEVVFEVGT